MVLVDTSVWLDYLRGNRTASVRKLDDLLERGLPIGITSLIYQEVLQGADSEASLARLGAYFGTQRFFHPVDPVVSHAEAARLYARCRWVGVTLRSTVDCLIAQVAIEHRLEVLHSDRDFDSLARVVPDLVIY